MTKHITSINLDAETSEIAKRMGNRSHFVRECLRRWNALQSTTHIHPTTTPKCFPSSNKGVCPICWPDGAPPHEAWLYYRDQGGRVVVGKSRDDSPIYEYHDYPTEWVEEQARAAATPEFSLEGVFDEEKTEDEPKTPLWERIKRLLRVGGR